MARTVNYSKKIGHNLLFFATNAATNINAYTQVNCRFFFKRLHAKKKKTATIKSLNMLLLRREPKAGLEPATYSLRMNCSTN